MKNRLIRFRHRYHGVIGWAAVIFWEMCTPFVFMQAWKFRGHPGLGGEIFWPFMPLFVRIIVDCWRGTFAPIMEYKHGK